MKKPKPKTPQRTETVRVASPYGHGVDVVKRVIDTIELMHKAGQLDRLQYQAAITYRTAFEIVWGQAGGAMDFSRVRGASVPGSPPIPAALSAADILLHVERSFRLTDRLVIEAVCGEGKSLSEMKARFAVKDPGKILRENLTKLGELWHPEAEGKGSKIRAFSEEKPLSAEAKREAIRASQEGEIGPVRAVHATGHKVYQKR